jgi:Alr-MurF fusion protein
MIYLEYLLEATQGELRSPGKQAYFQSFNHDSRQLMSGELFVAVRGERSNGHDYLLDAVQRGAAGLLVEAKSLNGLAEEVRIELEQVTIIAVEDTRQALQRYARAILARWKPIVIAVTGSAGKTSTKEAIASVLSQNFATFRSWQNYNDLLGLPLSLGQLEERHEYAVLEMGCDHPGEIAQLCEIAQPQIGILTNITPAHLQYFGSMGELASELSSLFSHLTGARIALYNQDDEISSTLLQQAVDRQNGVSYFPIRPFQLEKVVTDWQGTRGTLVLASGSGGKETLELRSQLPGSQALTTMLMAYQVASYCGMSDIEIQQALEHVRPERGRLNPLQGVYNARLLDDTHNAIPASMLAGLRALSILPARRRIAVLGDMLALGTYEEEAHRLVGREAAQCVDYLITRGERAALIAEAARTAGLAPERINVTSTHEDAAQAVLEILQQGDGGDSILLKGSEDMRMERVTERLLAQRESAQEQLIRQTPGWKQIVMTRPDRPTWIEVDLSAIANNTRRIRELVGEQVRILISLKADGYGHGALKVARTGLHNGASMLGVATVSEATPLRAAGVEVPILVFGYVPLWQMREAVRQNITVTLYSNESAQALSRTAQALGRTVNVHIKVDTGMSRLGILAERQEEIVDLAREISRLPGVHLEGVYTHFAEADSNERSSVKRQLARFMRVLECLEKEDLRPELVHAANSAATISEPEAHFDMVRPGIAIYGLDPSAEVRLPKGFRPALSFKTQVSQVKEIPAGEKISYGGTYLTERPTRIAVLPVGYADGFRRGPQNWGSVLIHGQEAAILGRVCMDQCMVDVSAIPQVRMGDEVVLIGQQGEARLSAERVAERLGTINYEVVAEILARVPRVD